MSNGNSDRRVSHRGSATVRRSRRSGSTRRTTVSSAASSGSTGGNGGNGDIKRIIAIGAAVVVIIGAFAFAVTKLGGGSRTAEESTSALKEGAYAYDAAIDLRQVLDIEDDSAETETTAADQEDSEAAGAAELPAGVVSIYGKTEDEVRSEIMSLYEWDLRVVNPDAEAGATVMPTVDPEETTAEATMGDPENPDSGGTGQDAAESRAAAEITVSTDVEVPDLILQQLNSLLLDINADAQEALAAEAEAESGEEEAGSASDEDAEGETEASGPVIYELSLEGAESEIDRIAELCATMWYKAPKGASIGSYDASTDEFVMEGAESGFQVDEEAMKAAISDMVDSKQYVGTIDVIGEQLSADSETNLAAYKIIGTYQTKTTSNSVRNKNIELACEALNGTIVLPGKELSFNDAVGQRTAEKGYGAAAAYNNGEVVQEIGGGVCQVSTTLYNAVLRAGLKTTRRQSHTFKPTYVTPGFDATISWGGPDYCFANVPADAEYSNSESYAIGIYAKYSDRTVTVSIYGRPVLKDGYTYELESEKIKDIPVVRKLIEPGSDQQPTTGSMGSQWQTYLIVKKDGEQVQRTLDHNTYYSGHVEYYTDQTTADPLLPSESESLTESQSETVPQIIEGVDGGPGVTGGPGSGTTTAPTQGQNSTDQGVVPTEPGTAPTDDHSYPQSTVPSGGPGDTSAPTEAQQIGPGIISDAPGVL